MPQVLDQLPVLGLRMVVGGLLVVAFAVIAELSEPKKLAGLFTAAPAVALGGLLVMLATKGAGDVRRAALGMIAGAIAMVVYCGLAAWGCGAWAPWLVRCWCWAPGARSPGCCTGWWGDGSSPRSALGADGRLERTDRAAPRQAPGGRLA
jgi:hypothetical protein